MRIDPPGAQITEARRDPRIAVGIIYPTGSIYITNRPGIANVPGNVIAGALSDLSASSQTLYPDQGRATIGSLTFTAVDIDESLTDELRTQLLTNDRGVNLREVRVFTGDTDDFADWQTQRVDTYVVDGVERRGRSYTFSCSDRTREQRVQIFAQATTRLSASITASDTSLSVLDTTGFEMLAHTAAFTDAPSTTVGYLLAKKTGELIRYTGKTATTFTGCTRGVFNTIAQAIVVDGGTAADRRPELIEFIYLEMPAPELLYAIQTGVILSSSATLPTSWHMGIDEAFVDSDRYEAIGTDLYDPSNPDQGLVLRFTHMEKTDGKRFVEEQVHVPMGTYPTVDVSGVLGLKRIVSLLSNSAPVIVLNDETVIEHGGVTHALSRVINRVVVDWNYDGEKFTRTNVLINQNSADVHGVTKPLFLELRGLHVSRHSETTINRIFNYITERYGAPPIEVEIKASRMLNGLEIGDTALLQMERIPDFAGASYLNRTVEIQSRRINWKTGDLRLQCFASTARTVPDAGGGTTPVLPDGYYSSAGTALSSVLTISSNQVTANGSLTGGADARTAVYYHAGNLTINAAVTVTIDQNVQLRIMGTLTINGAIDGAGNGLAGLQDPNTVSASIIASSIQRGGFIGQSFGGGRVNYQSAGARYTSSRSPWSLGENAAMPRLNIAVEADVLVGLPAELRGAPGGWGGTLTSGLTVSALGGDGGDGGAGLLLICRGLAFGVSGEIDLSGGAGSVGASASLGGLTIHAGAGGGGAPGGLYVLLDGDNVTYPDLSSAFISNQIVVTPGGTRAPSPLTYAADMPNPGRSWWDAIAAADRWAESHIIHYVPSGIELGESDDEIVPAPTGLSAALASDVGAQLTWTSPPADLHDFVEVWRATTNDRTGAVLVFVGKANAYFDSSASAITRYFWVRAGRNRGGYSEWEPVSSTGGVVATYGGASGQAQWTPVLSAGMTRNVSKFTKSSATSSWAEQFYSLEGYTACVVSWSPNQTNAAIMIGLNSDPATDANYTSIDYAIYAVADGNFRIYESGTDVTGSLGAYASGDQFAIVYDGITVRYFRNGSLLRSRAVASLSARMFADSSFFTPGGVADGVAFSAITGLSINALGWIADSVGKPAGVRGVHSATNRNQISLVNGRLRIASTPDTTGVYGLPAIPINPAKTYQITIKHLSSAASSDGNFLICYEYDSALPAGITHVGVIGGVAGTNFESVVVAAVSRQDMISNAAMPGTTAVVQNFSYVPTAGTEFVTLGFGNWDPATAAVTYDVEWVAFTEVGSNIDLLPSVVAPMDTVGLLPDAVDEIAQVENASSAAADATGGTDLVWAAFATMVVDATTDVIEVSATFRGQHFTLGGSPTPGPTYAVIAYRENPSGTAIEMAEPLDKTTAVGTYERMGGVASITGLTPDTYDFGLLLHAEESSGSGDYGYLAVGTTVVVTKVKR